MLAEDIKGRVKRCFSGVVSLPWCLFGPSFAKFAYIFCEETVEVMMCTAPPQKKQVDDATSLSVSWQLRDDTLGSLTREEAEVRKNGTRVAGDIRKATTKEASEDTDPTLEENRY